MHLEEPEKNEEYASRKTSQKDVQVKGGENENRPI